MRIGMIAPLEMRVPPPAYGGVELVVSLLTEELVRRGHEVTLFASGDSVTSARLVSVCDQFLRGAGRENNLLSLWSIAHCLERADEFDIVHSHMALECMALAGLCRAPQLVTLHGILGPDSQALFRQSHTWFNTISKRARAILPERGNFVGVVYNAIDVPSYPFNGGSRDDYVLFLSRISPEKGAHLAVEAAHRAGVRLLLAGNVDSVDRSYFKDRVLPLVDGDRVQYVGEVGQERKRELMYGARCLLAPLCWEEPFGLFIVEAMACGAPVIAFPRGAAPELLVHGVNGYLVKDVDEMAAAIGMLDRIAPGGCRRFVEENYSVARMTDDYLRAYAHVIQADRLQQGGHPVVVQPVDGRQTRIQLEQAGAKPAQATQTEE